MAWAIRERDRERTDIDNVQELSLTSTLAVISGSDEASLLGAMRGMYRTLHRTQGGRHDQSIRPAPRAPVPETTPGTAPCAAASAGTQGPCGATAARADSRATPQTGPQHLRPPRTGLHAPDLPP